jgi:hypothetical protein
MVAWRGWYHVNGNTYGTWLPGDPRGWRTKKHRRHVEGDYRSPPPKGTDQRLLGYSRDLLKRPPVQLDLSQRVIVGRALVEMLVQQGVEPLALSMGTAHFHLLARFTDDTVRPRVGRAKKHAWFRLRDHGFVGRLWTNDGKITPIKDRQHQLNAFQYIAAHKRHGAWVWTFREGLYWQQGDSQR